MRAHTTPKTESLQRRVWPRIRFESSACPVVRLLLTFSLTCRTYKQGDKLCVASEASDTIYIVHQGQAEVSMKGNTITVVDAGSSIGTAEVLRSFRAYTDSPAAAVKILVQMHTINAVLFTVNVQSPKSVEFAWLKLACILLLNSDGRGIRVTESRMSATRLLHIECLPCPWHHASPRPATALFYRTP